jgi:hypothetical protein
LGLALQPSAVLWASLQRCWGDNIFISTAADKFLRLTLQLVARYEKCNSFVRFYELY